MRITFWLFACLLFITLPNHANSQMAPATSYYMLGDHDSAYPLMLDSGGPSFDGHVLLSWPDFKQGSGNYRVEFRRQGDATWNTLYSGSDLHYYNALPLDSGIYEYRIHCAGFSGCPASGYLTHTSDVVLKPDYVNLAYDDKKQNVNVYWEDIKTQGYVIEHSLDRGMSWQQVIPQGKEVMLYHGQNFTGFISTSSDVVLPKQTLRSHQFARAQAQGMQALTKMAVSQSVTANFDPGSFQYRIKNCNMYRCGTQQLSNQFDEQMLKPLIQDPTFESGEIQFYPHNAEELVVNSSRPIDAERSLRASLKNWGYIEWEHKYSTWNNYDPRYGLNGMTARGLLRVDHLDPDSSLSIYPVAYYYEGTDDNGHIKGHRLEGQKMIISRASSSDNGRRLKIKTVRKEWEVDSSEIIDIDQQLYLNPSKHVVKNVKYYVRLLGSSARFTLDNAQLYENGGLGQYDPSFSIYLSNYIGELKTEWTDFAKTGLKESPNLLHSNPEQCTQPSESEFLYHVEYSAYGQNNWRSYYCGRGTRYFSAGGASHEALQSGHYEFRVKCAGFVNCPKAGYVKGYTVILREVDSVLAQMNRSSGEVLLSWSKSLGSYGYLIEQSADSGRTWKTVSPSAIDQNMVWRGNNLFTQNTATIPPGSLTGGTRFQFRVKACRYTRCQDSYGISNEIILSRNPATGPASMATIQNFKADKTRIVPGEGIILSWDRPKDQSGGDFGDAVTYNIYVTKPGYAEFSKWRGLKTHSIKREGETGIQRLGVQTFRIEACDSFGNCGGTATTSIEVVGRPPMPMEFTTDTKVISLFDSVQLSWKMSPNYTDTVTYNLKYNAPGWKQGYLEPLLTKSTQQTHSIKLETPGFHHFVIQACNEDGCSEERSLTIQVKLSAPTLKYQRSNLE
ncbi:fibronectin type III domain-containing protein [Pseudoalteromonas rubra]|uniref:fibronectin type III domain-containing protein n=1 Tax=Pseudoalteromonas rubra TaxID=43658 RepID=UPI000F7A4954|nr:fibronectin type III domain-containing protein [Pseudoalteromonas rubra]